MNTLEVSDEQYAFIQRLREAIADQVVGDYGYVRERDAIQFLIDNLDGSVSFEGKFEIEKDEDGTSISYDESAEETVDGVAVDAETDADEDADDSEEQSGTVILDEGEDEQGDGSADDDDMLDRMMNLLETHDDKWDESNKADYRYRVELPDGTSEHVQTKDDVRALLFKNY